MSDSKKSDHPNKIKKHFDKKWLLINLGIAAVFVLTLVVGFWLSSQNSNTTVKPVETKMSKMNSDARKLINAGNEADAITMYDKELKATDDSQEKIAILLAKASISYNQDDFEGALEITKQAEAIKETFAVTDFLAQIYEQLGDYTSAIKYYQKTITLMNKDSMNYDSDLKRYEAKIAELGEEG